MKREAEHSSEMEESVHRVCTMEERETNELSDSLRRCFDTIQTIARQQVATESFHLRAIMLFGAGSTFCSGADLKERASLSNEDWNIQHQVFQDVIFTTLLSSMKAPTVQACNDASLNS